MCIWIIGEGSSNRNASWDESVETRDESVETRDESIEAGEKTQQSCNNLVKHRHAEISTGNRNSEFAVEQSDIIMISVGQKLHENVGVNSMGTLGKIMVNQYWKICIHEVWWYFKCKFWSFLSAIHSWIIAPPGQDTTDIHICDNIATSPLWLSDNGRTGFWKYFFNFRCIVQTYAWLSCIM